MNEGTQVNVNVQIYNENYGIVDAGNRNLYSGENTDLWTEVEFPFTPINPGHPSWAIVTVTLTWDDQFNGDLFFIDEISFVNTVLTPQAGDHWIPGDRETIRWTAPDWPVVDIRCVLDAGVAGAESTIVIANGYPAVNPEYEWDIPDSLMSYHTRIMVRNNADTTQRIESGDFKLKGYTLAVLEDNETYVPFDRTGDAWRFGNTPSNMWPVTWWNRFNYATADDPFTGDRYDPEFHDVLPSRFPSWPEFVRAFGVGQCYEESLYEDLVYRDRAVDFWKSGAGKWGGSCFGFALSTLLAYDDPPRFQASYPEMPPYAELYQFPDPLTGADGDSIRYIINALWSHIRGKSHWGYYLASLAARTPTQTVTDLKQMLLSDDRDDRVLVLYKQSPGTSGAHAVVPYKLVQNDANPARYTVSVYDNSNPTVLNASVEVDTSTHGGSGSWTSPQWGGWGGAMGLYLMEGVSAYWNVPVIPGGVLDARVGPGGGEERMSRSGELTVYNTRGSEIRITDGEGRSVGFEGGQLFNEIPGAVPFIRPEPSEEPPGGYQLPPGGYGVALSSFTDSTAFVYLFTDTLIYSYRRGLALEGQTDRVNLGDGGFGVSTSDAGVTKAIDLKATLTGAGFERAIKAENVTLSDTDSVSMAAVGMADLVLSNYGGEKTYDLRLRHLAEGVYERFLHEQIALTENTTHTVVPAWGSLDEPVKIRIDVGNDGVIDDSVYVENETTGIGEEEHGSLRLPRSYALAQNYPNPFNPSTTIAVDIPAGGNDPGAAQPVTLAIYDLRGRKIRTLIDGERRPGRYTVHWDGRDDRGRPVSSGIYIYRLEAGDYIQSRKMVLMK